MKSKNILSDVILNMIASFLPMVVLQIVILPLLSKDLSSEVYGLLLAITSFVTLVSVSFGNSLNNSRLIRQLEYETANAVGDYNIILSVYVTLNAVIIFVGFRYFSNSFNQVNIIVLGSISCMLREYFSVEYRIQLSYKKALLSNLFLSAGYLLGFAIFKFSGLWQIVYSTGYLVSSLYILKGSSLRKEPFKKTALFNKTLKISTVLLITSFLGSAFTYIDRLIIYPTLGGESVSIYHAATVVGKLIIMGVTPISSVILSYLSKKKSIENKLFFKVFFISIVIGGIAYFFCTKISRIALELLYPNFVEAASKYINITMMTSVISMLSFVVSPFMLKFSNITWQLVLSVYIILVYVGLSIPLLGLYGLRGFCVGTLIANIIKLVSMLFVFIFNNTKNNRLNSI